jgi:hypothetical protein
LNAGPSTHDLALPYIPSSFAPMVVSSRRRPGLLGAARDEETRRRCSMRFVSGSSARAEKRVDAWMAALL